MTSILTRKLLTCARPADQAREGFGVDGCAVVDLDAQRPLVGGDHLVSGGFVEGLTGPADRLGERYRSGVVSVSQV